MINPAPLDVIETTPDAPVVRLGTRRSALARTQSLGVARRLAAATGWQVEVLAVVTEGDVNMAPLAQFGGTGVFVSAVRDALATGGIDVAVHSLKDLPTYPEPGIALAAVPAREDFRDALVARDGLTLEDLPLGATVATGSPRRSAQLSAIRPDLRIEGIRGNVGTRITAVTDGHVDAVVLACAGLRRLGREGEITQAFEPDIMVPAPGQGALGIECREPGGEPERGGLAEGAGPSDSEILTALASLDDAETHAAVVAERAVLARAEAGCSAPLGAVALSRGDELFLRAVLADDTGALVRREDHGATGDAHGLGVRVADGLLGGIGVRIGAAGGRQ